MDLPRAIDRLRQSVFQIQLTIETSPTTHRSMPIGTAFAVSNEGHLITALHVITAGEAALQSSGGSMQAMFAGPQLISDTLTVRASFVGQGFTVLDRDEDHDLALLQTGNQSLDFFHFRVGGPDGSTTKPATAALVTERPHDGESVAISGYPLGSPTLITNAGTLASSWAMDPSMQDMIDRYLGDFTANPGNSGGPVYRVASGGVIGMCHGVRLTDLVGVPGQQTAGVTVVIPSTYIVAFLTRNGVDTTVSKPPTTPRRSKRKR